MTMLDDPIKRLQVAQAAFAFFQIGLHDIAHIALPRVAIVAFFQLVGNKLGILARHSFGLESLQQIRCKRFIAKQKARIKQ